MLKTLLNSRKTQPDISQLTIQQSNSFGRQCIRLGFGLTFGCASLLISCADHNDVATPSATVALVNTSGASVGTAELTEDSKGMVTLKVSVKGLPAGIHGIHFHEVGVADPKSSPAFSSSGEHYNPASRKHGLENPDGTHAGDLPNLIVDSQGTGSLETTTNRITLSDGPTTLFDGNGSSLIIHASVDDQKTDPSGNSGGRIAGGVIVRK
ncbi:superoxide dismutase family protein [Spirosoma validum]|uniref:Superoxide dismutase family protein n=1 Tax=Spirosoma validum TaxID=2771355 RepID=A0A927B4F5_9BACT|nr:superoxide dismutase family protein [Spirosoma validum]MBD2755086.1 superoxide dismutase family protein [Spirosoma validum]